MTLLSRPRRCRRAHEWNEAAAVTFIVTLAATRSVTLAARAAGRSRKSAYALQERDAAFAAAWNAALRAGQGNEVEEVEDPPGSLIEGNARQPAVPRSTGTRSRAADAAQRDAHFARLAARVAAPSVVTCGKLSPCGDTFPTFLEAR